MEASRRLVVVARKDLSFGMPALPLTKKSFFFASREKGPDRLSFPRPLSRETVACISYGLAPESKHWMREGRGTS